ncbi:30S ribosomal protein S9 [Mycoplasma sp. SG1]|uniref:30S ribosomal protein S9 n=1 Tax=Mycoplasma sp. SG1 TaxID=2810348 RepID=UPI002023D1CF|nr:30S ribosomal protein S9 [Mycoplasma sp. SG1]URM52923.1 30S ribosomal protein S9 [Mycoplasma sp. SG1]
MESTSSTPKKSETHPSKILCCGKRKTSVANVQLISISAKNKHKSIDQLIFVNSLPIKDYFVEEINYLKVLEPLKLTDQINKFEIKAKIVGGGKTSQAESLRHGISKALTMYDESFKAILKLHNFLTRDARIKERKKPGLKKARKAPQFAKR